MSELTKAVLQPLVDVHNDALKRLQTLNSSVLVATGALDTGLPIRDPDILTALGEAAATKRILTALRAAIIVVGAELQGEFELPLLYVDRTEESE